MSGNLLNARNTDIDNFAALVKQRSILTEDFVATATKLRSEDGVLLLDSETVELTADGVTTYPSARYVVSQVFLEGLATRLEVPVGYLKRVHANRPDIFDNIVNGHIHGGEGYSPDVRNFLVRTFRGEGGNEGIARALLSDTFKTIDDQDVLVAVIKGIQASGVKVAVESCDLTDRKSYLRISAPEVCALAPTLLDGYRSAFNNGQIERSGISAAQNDKWAAQNGDDSPVVFAGFVVTNSETGGGAFNIVPRIVIRRCRNGLVQNIDAFKKVHLGGRLEEGLVKWTEDTQRKNLELITSQAQDAVATFLNVEYVQSVIARYEEKAGIAVVDPAGTIEKVAKTLKWTQEEADGILNHFILGAQLTAGGVLNAVTSFAQTVADADQSYELEVSANAAFELVAA